jgi:hypothetical protein
MTGTGCLRGHERLDAVGVVTDFRDDRLRPGFDIYHDEAGVEELLRRLVVAIVATG